MENLENQTEYSNWREYKLSQYPTNNEKLLVTSKKGKLWIVGLDGTKTEVIGVPPVAYAGQGGLGDIILHPNFTQNRFIYFSYIEKDKINPTLKGAVVARAILEDYENPRLRNTEIIWEQVPKLASSGHYSHRILFGPQGSKHEGKLFTTSGDRQIDALAQKFDTSMGKLIRINADGTFPKDNPFQDKGELAKSFWTLGHRNALGIAFDKNGNLWSHEMGPRHGDELNLIKGGMNYG